jgi:hypothetical protein
MVMTASDMNQYPTNIFEFGNDVATGHGAIIHTIHTALTGRLIFCATPPFFDSLIRLLNCLRQDARLTDSGHEIRVTRPARDDVQVDVVWHARARGLADVSADVECLWIVDLFQEHDSLGDQFHHLSARFAVKKFQRGLMCHRRDHDG